MENEFYEISHHNECISGNIISQDCYSRNNDSKALLNFPLSKGLRDSATSENPVSSKDARLSLSLSCLP